MISNIAKEFINLAISKLELEKPPTHTQGIATCGEVELEFVDKIAMAKLVGIE